MARLIGPSEASREVKSIDSRGYFKTKGLRTATFYTTAEATVLADVINLDNSPIAGSTVTIDAYSMLPLIQLPDGVDTVWVIVDGGPAWPVYAREDDRLDSLNIRVTAIEAGGSDDVLLVHKAGAETITGVKTHTVSPIVPTPIGSTDAGNKGYIDTAVAGEATARATAITTEATTRAAGDTAAIATAATDATTKANNAQSAAIAAAATDATTKANAAQAAAIAAAATDATSKVAAEATTRAAADTTNAAAISAEATTRANADAALLPRLTTTTTKTGAYTAGANELVPVDATSGTVPITLLSAAAAGRGTVVAVKKIDTSTNPVTVQRAGSDTINTAATSATLSLPDEVFLLVSDGVSRWTIGAGQKSLSSLDARYAKAMGWIVVTDILWGSDPFGTNPRTALAAAPAGSTVYFPPGTYSSPTGVGSGYTVVADNVTVLAGKAVTINVTTWGQAGIDCIDRSGVQVIGGLTVAYTGTRGDASGAAYRGSNAYSNCCGVYVNKDRCRVQGLRTVGMPVCVFLSSWDSVAAQQSYHLGIDNVINDVEFEGSDFGILWVGQKGLKIDGVYGHDDIDDSSGANPCHVYYASGNATLGSTDIVITNIRAENILHGQAFQLKYCNNVRLGPHSARNCAGLINLLSVTDLQWDGMGGTAMLANSGQGSITIQTGSVTNARLNLKNTSVTNAAGVDERIFRATMTDSEVDGMMLTTNRPASPSNPSDYEFIVEGSSTRYRGVTIRSRGAGHVRAFNSGAVGVNSPNLSFEDFVCESTVGLIDVSAASTGVVIKYDPGAQQSIVGGSFYVGSLGGSATYSVARSEYERPVTVASGSTTPRPNPYLETRTYLNVTDSSAFTIVNPSGGTPNVGTTLEVVVANNSGGTLGTVIWDTAYTLLTTPYTKPVAGKSTLHRFRHDGTTWVEVAPPVTPPPASLTVTGLTGAITQARFVGSTTSGAPVSGTFAVNDYITSTDGNFYICTAAGTPGTWVAVGTPASLTALAANALTTGEVVPQRGEFLSNAVSVVSGTLSLVYFTADKTESINTLTAFTGATAAAATPTLIRYGVYSVAGNGDITLIASTVNDTTLLAATNLAYPKALSGTWNKVVGQRYAVGPLVVSGGTMPSYHGKQLTSTAVVNTLMRTGPAMAGRLAGQSDLPSTATNASLSGIQAMIAIQMS